LGSSMSFIDGTVVNVALPALQANLNATAIDVQWVVESYALFLAALLLLGGSLGDHFGRKRIYAIGVTLFALASMWCGLAPNVGQLIVARAVVQRSAPTRTTSDRKSTRLNSSHVASSYSGFCVKKN